MKFLDRLEGTVKVLVRELANGSEKSDAEIARGFQKDPVGTVVAVVKACKAGKWGTAVLVANKKTK